MHRAAVDAAVVVEVSAHRETDRPVPVDVARTRERVAEQIGVVEGGRESAGGVADLLLGPDGAVGLEHHDVDGPPLGATVVVEMGADRQVADTVGVDVAHTGERRPEAIVVVEGGGESAGGVADLLLGPDGAVGVQEQDVDRAPVGAAVVVGVRSDREIGNGVAVEVAEPGDRLAEQVAVVEGGGESAGGVADLLFGLDGAVGVEEQDVHSAAIRGRRRRPGTPRPRCRSDAVGVDVADAVDGDAELVIVVEHWRRIRRRCR